MRGWLENSVCVSARARARARACVCVCVYEPHEKLTEKHRLSERKLSGCLTRELFVYLFIFELKSKISKSLTFQFSSVLVYSILVSHLFV